MLNNDLKIIFRKINRLKAEKDVVILSHYYMPPELQRTVKEGGVADFLGDSLGLSMEAERTPARNILFCGVRFMAETVLLINPAKKVFMPAPESGCSLASSITAFDIMKLKEQYPRVPVMGYINTYAETKTAIDICCTSRNALSIVEALDADRIIFVPDLYMGQNLREAVAEKYGKQLILWKGTCEVHEQFRNEIMSAEANDGMEVLMHWEVPGDTVKAQLQKRKGIVGSTGDIINYVKNSSANRFFLASECDLGNTLKKMNADKEFISPCIKCSYMKQNTLEKLLLAMEAIGTGAEDQYRIELDPEIIQKARQPVLKMLTYN